MKKLLLSYLLINCSFFFNEAFAQDGMGIGNSNPQEMLDVTGAIKIGGTIVGAADAGSMRWNGTSFQGYNGTQWVDLDSQGGVDSDWTVSGNNQHSAVSGNVGIGTTTPTQKLEVNGTIKITGGSPGAGKVLTSDVNGSATWETPSGGTVPTETYGEAALSSNYIFPISTATNIWHSAGLQVTLPTAGTYRVYYSASGICGSGGSGILSARLFNNTAGTGVADSESMIGYLLSSGEASCASNESFITVTDPTVISLQGKYTYASTSHRFISGIYGTTKITYLKISN